MQDGAGDETWIGKGEKSVMVNEPPEIALPKKKPDLFRGCLGVIGGLVALGLLGSLFSAANDDAARAARATEPRATVAAQPTAVPATFPPDPAALLPTSARLSLVEAVPVDTAVVLLGTASAEVVEPTAATAEATGRVTDTANVRDIPTTDGSTVLGLAAVGDRVTIRGKVSDGSWYAVTLANGLEGWISAPLVAADATVIDGAVVLATPIPAVVTPEE